MSSVNAIQPEEPRVQPMNQSQARNGDPFAELLDGVAGNRPSHEDARLDQSKREQPTAPVSRADEPAGEQAAAAAGDTKPAEEPVKNETAAVNEGAEPEPSVDAAASEETSENAADTPDKKDSAQTDATPGSIESADKEPTETPEANLQTAVTVDAAPAVPQGNDAPAIAPVADAPAAPIAETSVVPSTANPDTPSDAKAAPVVAAPQTAAAPQAPVQAADAVKAAPIAPGNSVGTAPNADQAPAPQPAQANPNAAAFGEAMEAFTGDADQQAMQQQNGSPQVQAKLQEAAVARPAEAGNAPTAPVDSSAPKIQPNPAQPAAMPEPVRALNASFDPASLSAANTNESKPVPLSGPAIAVEIVSRMREGMRRFDIRLDPPELGRIDVRLEVDRNGNVSTKLTVDRPETLELVQREARGLERALQQAGLKTDAGGLEFSLRQQTDERFAHGHSGRGELYAEPAAHEGKESVETVIQGYRSTAFARGGVDIRV